VKKTILDGMIFLYYNLKPKGKTDRGSAKTAGREDDYSLGREETRFRSERWKS
jgi:hypothetical protein